MEEHLEFQNELSKLLSSDSTILKRIHIDESFSSDSEPDGRLLDEDYMKNQPPPCDYNIIKDHVVKIGTELIGTKKKKKKKKRKTNGSCSILEHAPTKFSLESDVSLLSLAKYYINPFSALVTTSDHSPADIMNLYLSDDYNTDTQTVGDVSSEKYSSKFVFDFVSEVDSSWETAMNKKSKKLRKNQINEKTVSPSLELDTIMSNITSDSNKDNLALTHCDNVNNNTYFFLHQKSDPIHPNTMIGITNYELHNENVGCKKKTKKNKKARKKTSEFPDSTHLNNVIPAASAVYINNVSESSPSTCYETSTQSGGIIRSEDTKHTKGESTICFNDKPNHILCVNPLPIKKNKELSQNIDESVKLSQSMDIRHRKKELPVVTYDSDISCVLSLSSATNGMLFQSNDKSGQCQRNEEIFEQQITLSANHIDAQGSSSEMQERVTSGAKNEVQKKNPLKQLPPNDCVIQDIHIEEALSQQQSIIESESIIWDWELHNNRKIHEATPNKIDLFGSDESIHTSTLSIAEGATHIGKVSQSRTTEQVRGNTQYPIKGSYLFEYGARLQKNDAKGNLIYITPNDDIDTCILENDVASYALGTQMQPEKKQSGKKKRKRSKKKCQKQPNDNCFYATQLSIPAAKAELDVDNITSSSDYVGLHSLSSTHETLAQSGSTIASGGLIREVDNIKSHTYQPSSKVDDLFENVLALNTYRHRETEKDVNSHALGIKKQPQQTKASKQECIKKWHKGIPISEHDIQDSYIFDESGFPPLFANNIICSVGNITPSVPNVDSMAWKISGVTKSPIQSNLVNSATLPEPAPSNLFHHNNVSGKIKHIQNKQNIGGSNMTKRKSSEAEYPFTAHHTNRSLTKHGTEKLENDIIRFFQSNIPYELTANISAISQPGVFGRDNTEEHDASFVDKKIGKIYELEHISYFDTEVSKTDPVSHTPSKIINNSSQKAVPRKIKSDCAQNILLNAITNCATNVVHISEERGMKWKLSYISNILASHTEIIKCHQNISYLSIMIPGYLFQHIQKDQKCQSFILDFLIAGSGLQQQTSLFFYNDINEKNGINVTMKESLYLHETSQKKLYHKVSNSVTLTETYENAEIENDTQITCHYLENVEITATITKNIQNLNTSCIRVECEQFLSSDTNTCFEVMTNTVQYHLPTYTVPALLEDHGMTDSRQLGELSNILAMNTEIKFHDNIHISIMIPENLSELVQKDQKCQNLILDFLTAGVSQDRTSLFFYEKIDGGAIGDDSMADFFYHLGKLHKKTAYKDKYVHISRPSNSVEVIDTYKTKIENPTNSICCSLDSVSIHTPHNIENMNVCCKNAGFEELVSSEDNGTMESLIDGNTCFDMIPRSDSTQSIVSASSSCSSETFDPICDIRNLYASTAEYDNVQNRRYSSIVRTDSNYSSIVVENVLRLSFNCLFGLIQDII